MRGQASSSPGRQVKRLPPGHPMPPGMPTAPTAPVPFARKVVPRLSAPNADAPLPLLDAVAPLPVLVLQPIPPLQPPPTFPPIPLTPQQVAELPAIDADGVMIIDAPPAAVARWPPADPSPDEWEGWTKEQWETYDRKGREYAIWKEKKEKAGGGAWKKGCVYSKKNGL